MASTASPLANNGGVSASMWANAPTPTRNNAGGKGSEFGSGSRGMSKGGPRGKARGGRGGRTGGGRGPPSKGDNPPKKANGDQAQTQQKSSSDSTKPAVPPPPPAATESQPKSDPQPAKLATRPKPPRKGSESKGSQKVTKPVVEIPAAISKTNSSSTASPRTPSRRKRSNAQKPQPAPPPPVPRKPSPVQEITAQKEKPPVPAAPAKDVPPHLAPPKTFDIKHDIDALVERVRAVAMDRPHTPGHGSHFDWAGDEDDSLPDLDDWGVPSTSNTTDSLAEPPQQTPPPVNIISPILQDALKPLPSLMDVDIPAPSIKLHEVNDEKRETKTADAGDETPRKANGTASAKPITPTPPTRVPKSREQTTPPVPAQQTPKLESKQPHNVVNGKTIPNGVSCQAPVAGRPPSTDPLDSPGSAGLESSMHALPTSPSAPSHFGHRPPREFKPTHGRAHTVGRFKDNHHSDPDRPRKGDAFSHGRNHSTPPTGMTHRTPANRPVITGAAISLLAKTLGGSPRPKREREPTAPATATASTAE